MSKAGKRKRCYVVIHVGTSKSYVHLHALLKWCHILHIAYKQLHNYINIQTHLFFGEICHLLKLLDIVPNISLQLDSAVVIEKIPHTKHDIVIRGYCYKITEIIVKGDSLGLRWLAVRYIILISYEYNISNSHKRILLVKWDRLLGAMVISW